MRLVRLALLGLMFLAACKDAETGGGTPVSGGDPNSTSVFGAFFVSSFAQYEAVASQLRNSARYQRQNNQFLWNGTYLDTFPLASSRVEYAHAVGLTGRGETIAISDGGFRSTHEAFAGRSITKIGNPEVGSAGISAGDADHGTTVASIAAGNSSSMIGVAPGASLILGSFADQDDLAATAELARTRGAVALNNSWGYVLDVSQNSFDVVFSGADGARYLSALRSYASEGVVVFALSNDPNATVSDVMQALPQIDPSFTAGWLAVGNAVPQYDADGVVDAERISSRCLQAAAWCMVADGFWEGADAVQDNSYSTGTGSSYAAPQVSGALALLAEAFPNLNPHDLRLRLLASADNGWFSHSGSVQFGNGVQHGYNQEFGHGFLDLRAALLPIGPTTLSVNGQQLSIEDAVVRQGSALGDSLEQALSAVSVLVTDGMQAGFGLRGDSLTMLATPLPLSARFIDKPVGHATLPIAGFAEYSGMETALSIHDGPVTIRLLHPQSGAGSMGLSVTNRFEGAGRGLDLGLSLTRDGGEVFGLGRGPSGDGTVIATLNLGFDARLGTQGFLRLGAEMGMARAVDGSILGQIDTLGVNSFSAEIGQRDVLAKGDSLVMGVTAPMTVTSGHARTQISTFAANGKEGIANLAIPLAPAAREHVLAIGYDLPLTGPMTRLRLDLAHAINWGNHAAARDTAAGLTLTFGF